MTCSRELNKAKLFEKIIAEMNGNIEAEETATGFTGSGPKGTTLPVHRDLYTPLVWILLAQVLAMGQRE